MSENFSDGHASTWGHAWGLWLLTNVFGVIGCWLSFRFSGDPTAIDETWIPSLISTFAAVGSTLAIPLMRPVFRWVLAPTAQLRRLISLLLAVAGFWSGVVLVSSLLTGGLALVAVYMGGWTYLPGALLATLVVYRKALFRTNA
jgi:hypothetical protein